MALNKKKFVRIFWGTAAGIFLLIVLLFALIAGGMFGFMPTFEHLENPSTDLASEVYSADGVLLGYIGIENRSNVDYKDLPPHLVNALIAREDHRFPTHSGIDGTGLLRVAVKTVLLQRRNEGGGSTITQQLAKQLFKRDTTTYSWGLIRKANMVTIKFKEWVIAARLEKQYTKQEIITMYLNAVPFGYNAFGIKSAAQTYFQQSVDSLKIEDAAMLVGMLQRPSWYNPVKYPDRVVVRRNSVLTKMEEHDFITKAQLDSLKQLPLNLKFERLDHQSGTATYFREYLRLIMNRKKPERRNYPNNPQSFMADSIQWADNPLFGWCNKNMKPDQTPYNLYVDGLKIYTTIDSRMQKYAEEALRNHLKNSLQKDFFNEKKGHKKAPFADNLTDQQIEGIMLTAMRQTERYRILRAKGLSQNEIVKNFKEPCEMTIFTWDGDRDTIMSPWDSIRHHKAFLRASMMAMNPHTGEVKAYVGGIDFKHFQYDGVKMQKRQVGSTFKPFLYTLAMQDRKELTPCTEVLNVPQTFIVGDSTWAPQSSGKKEYFNRPVTLKWGLATSENNITAWLLKQVSPAAVVEMAKKMGIISHIDPVPSIVLGTPEITLAEMVAAFAVYPNKGVYSEPIYVTRIEDNNGNVLQRFSSLKDEAISAQTAYLMTNLLEGVVNGGTATRLRTVYGLKMPLGGKTGTTQKHADGWYIGITPDLVAGVWVGGEEPSIHFDNMRLGQGSAMALPIYGLFMQKVYADKNIRLSQEPFERPDGFNVDMNCDISRQFEGVTEYSEYNE